MVETILIAAFVVLFVIFLLSVFGPMHSERKFWITIQKIRAGMDLVVYWMFNICAVLSISYLVLATLIGMLRS